jgi:hypothetical protein
MSRLLDSLLDRERIAECLANDEPRLITRDDPIVAGLTPQQRKQRDAMLAAMRAGELRGPPSCFGELA